MRRIFKDYMPESTLDMQGKEEMKHILSELPGWKKEVLERKPAASKASKSGAAAVHQLEFSQFLILMRRFYDSRDEKDIFREEEAIKDCEYSTDEVEAFRQVFLGCVDSSGEMDLPCLIQLLAKLIAIGENEEWQLRVLIKELSPERREVVRFPQFLRLVHHVITKNMFGLSTTAEQVAGAQRMVRQVQRTTNVAAESGRMQQLQSSGQDPRQDAYYRRGSRI